MLIRCTYHAATITRYYDAAAAYYLLLRHDAATCLRYAYAATLDRCHYMLYYYAAIIERCLLAYMPIFSLLLFIDAAAICHIYFLPAADAAFTLSAMIFFFAAAIRRFSARPTNARCFSDMIARYAMLPPDYRYTSK